MKRKPPFTEETAVQYLENVVSNWKEFGKGHSRIISAIVTVLDCNKKYKSELSQQSKTTTKKTFGSYMRELLNLK